MAQQAVEKVGVDKHNFARTGRMALYGGGTLFPIPSLPLPTPSPSSFPTNKLTQSPRSRLRPRSHNLVFPPRPPHQLPRLPQPHHRRARPDGPDRLRLHEPLLLPLVHGAHGGDGPEGEVEGNVLGGAEEELDGLASCAGG